MKMLFKPLKNVALVTTILIAGTVASAQETIYEDAFLDSSHIDSADGDFVVCGESSYEILVIHERDELGHWNPETTIDVASDPDREFWVSEISGNHLGLWISYLNSSQHWAEAIELYHRGDDGWHYQSKIELNDELAPDWVCTEFSLKGDNLIVSAARWTDPTDGTFQLRFYQWNGVDWQLQNTVLLESSDLDPGDDWVLSKSWFYSYFEGTVIDEDRIVITEHLSFSNVEQTAWLEFPVLHTLERGDDEDWTLVNSFPFEPTTGPGESDETCVWMVCVDSKNDRLLTRTYHSFMNYELNDSFSFYNWSEFSWNDSTHSWVEVDLPFSGLQVPFPGMDEAWHFELLDENRLFVHWDNRGVYEYHRTDLDWVHAARYTDTHSDGFAYCNWMTLTDTNLFTTARWNDDESGTLIYDLASLSDNAGDVTGDGSVNVDDLLELIQNWGEPHPDCDIDGSGVVDVNDLLMIIQNWGSGSD